MARVLDRGAHESFFVNLINGTLPEAYASLDSQRMMLLFFAASGLEMLGGLHSVDCDQICNWIYEQQLGPTHLGIAGFRGGPCCRGLSAASPPHMGHEVDGGHIAMTYAALASLVVLGDNLARVRVDDIVVGVCTLQNADGSWAAHVDGETDVRFSFCAAAICTILGAWGSVHKDKAVDYILKCQSHEGGFGMCPGLEAHGGSTYCALAALSLLNALGRINDREKTIQWCISLQSTGFQGRLNKDPDTCYSFWVGASLAILGASEYISVDRSYRFTCSCQYDKGGIAKSTALPPDPLHTYFGLLGLSLLGVEGLPATDPELAISARASSRIADLALGSPSGTLPPRLHLPQAVGCAAVAATAAVILALFLAISGRGGSLSPSK